MIGSTPKDTQGQYVRVSPVFDAVQWVGHNFTEVKVALAKMKIQWLLSDKGFLVWTGNAPKPGHEDDAARLFEGSWIARWDESDTFEILTNAEFRANFTPAGPVHGAFFNQEGRITRSDDAPPIKAMFGDNPRTGILGPGPELEVKGEDGPWPDKTTLIVPETATRLGQEISYCGEGGEIPDGMGCAVEGPLVKIPISEYFQYKGPGHQPSIIMRHLLAVAPSANIYGLPECPNCVDKSWGSHHSIPTVLRANTVYPVTENPSRPGWKSAVVCAGSWLALGLDGTIYNPETRRQLERRFEIHPGSKPGIQA